MKRIVLLVVFMCVLLSGCSNGQEKTEEIIGQLEDEGKGTSIEITDAQIDMVNAVLDKYFPDSAHPVGYKHADYETSQLENMYLIKGVYDQLKPYSMVISENEKDSSYELESFYADGKKIY